jgi:hypothetical protein
MKLQAAERMKEYEVDSGEGIDYTNNHYQI